MKRNLKWAAVAVGCAAIVAAAFVGGRAWAGGIPAAGALNYSGLLQDASGAPLSGTQYIEVKFWNDATASAAANLLCDTMTPTAIGLSNGRFSITLPDKCTTQVGSNIGIWTEVFVGPKVDAVASLGRSKIGAVPFAVEANHAVSADSAASATGALKQTADALQADADYAGARLGTAPNPAVDLTWAFYHAAAVGACAALNPGQTGSSSGGAYVLNSGTCSALCAALPATPNCRGAVAVGSIPLSRQAPGGLVGAHYLYSCGNTQGATREGGTNGLSPNSSGTFSYCCCSG